MQIVYALSKRKSDVSLYNSQRAKRLLELARKYLPTDWRYPRRGRHIPPNEKDELKKLIPVESYLQHLGYSCGPTSLAMLLSAYSYFKSEDILGQWSHMTEDGTDPSGLVDAAEQAGFHVVQRTEASIDDITEQLDNGNPVLIDYQVSYAPDDDMDGDAGHYSVVVAADNQDFLIVDPSAYDIDTLHIRRVPITELPGIWWDTTIGDNKRFDRWMMSIHPKDS